MNGLPRQGEVLDLGPREWSYLHDGLWVVPGERPLRLRVVSVDEQGACSYAYSQCWVRGDELDESGRPVRCVHALVPVGDTGGGSAHGKQ